MRSGRLAPSESLRFRGVSMIFTANVTAVAITDGGVPLGRSGEVAGQVAAVTPTSQGEAFDTPFFSSLTVAAVTSIVDSHGSGLAWRHTHASEREPGPCLEQTSPPCTALDRRSFPADLLPCSRRSQPSLAASAITFRCTDEAHPRGL